MATIGDVIDSLRTPSRQTVLSEGNDLASVSGKLDVPGADREISGLTVSSDSIPSTGTLHSDIPETKPRFSERRISDDVYDSLRPKTPSPEMRTQVNEGISFPVADPALPGLQVKKFEANHIVSMDRITTMDGFEKLTREQQLRVLNYEENFIGLSKSANASKGSKTYAEWTMHKGKNIEVNPEFRAEMMAQEANLERKLQGMIDYYVEINER